MRVRQRAQALAVRGAAGVVTGADYLVLRYEDGVWRWYRYSEAHEVTTYGADTLPTQQAAAAAALRANQDLTAADVRREPTPGRRRGVLRRRSTW